MWSKEAREAALEARRAKASGHNAGKGNRKVAKHVADQHQSVAWNAAKGALVGSLVPGVGTVAGAVIGGTLAYRHNRDKKK